MGKISTLNMLRKFSIKSSHNEADILSYDI